ncbi:hypothetical protein LINGRAHAP2_LOCUS22646 [Linum grandiflorum]
MLHDTLRSVERGSSGCIERNRGGRLEDGQQGIAKGIKSEYS